MTSLDPELASALIGHGGPLKVLYITGYNHKHNTEDSNESIVLFRKPFTGSELARKLREVLDDKIPSGKTERE